MPDSKQLVTVILSNKRKLITLSWVLNGVGLCIAVLSYFVTALQSRWLSWGDTAGQLAVLVFCMSLLPGILKRFAAIGVAQQLQLVLMSFRRQFGVMMYFFVLEHYLWVKVLPSIQFSVNFLTNSSLFELFGLLAFFALTPLVLTSNEFSVRLLGKYWKVLHKLVYVTQWLIFLHLLFLGRGGWTSVLIYMIGLLEITSWLVKNMRVSAQTQSAVNVPLPTVPQQPVMPTQQLFSHPSTPTITPHNPNV